jgi:cytidyltransferase-like protein
MKVVVTGCFDMLHCGHLEFLRQARSHGSHLTVIIGSDRNIRHLKGAFPVHSEDERRTMLLAMENVNEVMCDSGLGSLSFREVLAEMDADVFVVNQEGDSKEKANLIQSMGMKYVVLNRNPPKMLKHKSTTELKNAVFPFRINLAGGWIDQPWVSSIHPGSVVNVSVWGDYKPYGGMATSTRKTMMLMRERMPLNYETYSKLLFGADNPPGTADISGSQDAIGLVYPGVVRMDFDGKYWPEKIEHTVRDDVLDWLERHLRLRWMGARAPEFNPLETYRESEEHIRLLGESGRNCWDAIVRMDIAMLKETVVQTREAWRQLLPKTVEKVDFQGACGLTGAGGGGYAIHIGDGKGEPIMIRRAGNE